MKQLEMVFKSQNNKVRTLRLSYVNEELNEEKVKEAMNKIAKLRMFKQNGEYLYETPVSANYTETNDYSIFKA
ncbi:DUF2922 family protein [Lactobacillus sp. S2-2]|uniref:DUF2922 domain-containing protein n=1 Tax=Lactobacillus sp. S2-2 TaxID=2692917 RepID=UPI001F18AACE|nr:DUF2922 domain-containing protein [Lactobacillus sp. S2-2]MCF6515225.1 DUF2922 family protein [Lactobacillus sp. S2-2]